MRTLCGLSIVIGFMLPLSVMAEDFEVIPKIEKGNMKNINKEFGQSIAEARKSAQDSVAKSKDSEDAVEDTVKERKDNFGAKASAEAKKLRDQADRKGGIGEWARQNNPGADKRQTDAGAAGLAKAAAARDSAPGGRPTGVGGGKPEDPGNGNSKGKGRP